MRAGKQMGSSPAPHALRGDEQGDRLVEELQRLFQQAGLVHADETPVVGLGAGDVDMPYFEEFFKQQYPVRRTGVPEDIANVHAFLVSSDADFVSGVTIPVTGGQLGGM